MVRKWTGITAEEPTARSTSCARVSASDRSNTCPVRTDPLAQCRRTPGAPGESGQRMCGLFPHWPRYARAVTAKQGNGGTLPAGASSDRLSGVTAEPAASTDWWKRNVLGLLAIAPVLLAAVRLIILSRGDPVLLSALAQSLDVPTVLLGGIVPSLGIAWSYGLFVVIANREITPVFDTWIRGLRPVPMTLFMVFQAVVILTTPLRDALVFLALPAVGLLYRWSSSAMDKRGLKYSPADVPAVVATALIVGLIAWPPWLPAEALTFSDGTQQTAYVTATSAGWTTLVDTKSRAVSRVPADSIVAREVCGAGRGRTLLNVVSGGSPQLPCPEADRQTPAPPAVPTPTVDAAPELPSPTT